MIQFVLLWCCLVSSALAFRNFVFPRHAHHCSNSNFFVRNQQQHADLTPGVDKYPIVPPATFSSSQLAINRQIGDNSHVDPFSLVSHDLLPLTDHIQDLLQSENFILTQAASHFFKQVISTVGSSIIWLSQHHFLCRGKESVFVPLLLLCWGELCHPLRLHMKAVQNKRSTFSWLN